MKSFALLLLSLVVGASLLGCDAKPTEVVKTVHDTDTVYTDRFARTRTVVYGEWTVTITGDTADAFFFQDSSNVTAYIPWKHGTTWSLTGKIVSDSISLSDGATLPFLMYGKFTKVESSGTHDSSRIANEMKGSYLNVANMPSGSIPTWTAVRKL
jgi:hypothetical protein